MNAERTNAEIGIGDDLNTSAWFIDPATLTSGYDGPLNIVTRALPVPRQRTSASNLEVQAGYCYVESQ